ncbi:hypothetical protein Tco_1338357 [Tanacetum coccineum]
MDALVLTPCYPAFLITADRYLLDSPRVPGRNFDALPSEEDTISFLRDLGHTGVINSLNDDVIDQMHQSLRTFAAIINRSLLEKMKESKAYKTYLGYATGEVPPKARLKDTAKSLLLIQQTVSSSKSLPFVDTKFKKEREKEKVDVAHGKGIELLSEVALSEKAQMKESESESWGNDEDDSNNEQESSDESSKQENESEEQESDSEQDEESNDDDQEEEDHLDTRLGETRQEFMNFLSESLTARIKEQVKDQLPQILPQEVSNFAPPVIEKLIKESRDEVTLAKVSSQPQSTYEAASTLTEFELKKILLDKMEKSESYLTAPEHRDCYDGLKKSYALDKDFFYSYDVYSLKRGRKDKDKDEDPSAGSDQGLKKRKTSKDAEPTTGPKKKDSTSGSHKCIKSQPKYTRKSVQSKEPVFEVVDSNMPQDQAGNLGDNEDEPRDETASRSDWFKKPIPPKEPTDPDWNVSKTTKKGPTQTWLMNLAASNPTEKSLKDFDELMSTPIDFYSFVLNGLKIENLTQQILLGPAFRLLKGTRSNYVELEYDFEECIEDMVPNIWSLVKVAYDKYGIKIRGAVVFDKALYSVSVNFCLCMRKHGYGYLEEIVVRRSDNVLYRFKEGDFSRLRINDIEDMLILVVQNRLTNLSRDDVADFAIAPRMFTRSLVTKASRRSSTQS